MKLIEGLVFAAFGARKPETEKRNPMAQKAPDVYQGNDWLTYRWPVAQAFDTLDRIRDLCRHAPMIAGSLPHLPGTSSPRYEMPEEDEIEIFGIIAELCDDLSGELDAVQADLFPYLQNDAAQRWMGFEMRLHLNEMRAVARREHESPDPSDAAIDVLAALAARIRDLLRHLDQ